MRRLLLTAMLVLATAGGLVAATAGADDSHTYTIELDNAFGIVKGSEVRVAGVTSGTVEDLDINADKRAVVTVELSGPLSQLGDETECSSEPQSLIAEYFIDCEPQGDPIPAEDELGDGDDPSTAEPNVPVERTTQTVQADLVQNTLREPFKRRLQLIINEFGTALAGNGENLNAAIRRGAPALRQLDQALQILADQNTIIRDLNADSDRIFARLADRREDVVKFIKEARDTAAASAERREDLAANFDLLDDFLAELRPTLVELGDLAVEQTPLLVNLRAAAPQLNELAVSLPAFNQATEVSLRSLGRASVVGAQGAAQGQGRDQAAAQGRQEDAARSSELLADFLRDLDDPDRHVEENSMAATETGRDAPTGYSGLEGLLNYVYYQAGVLNQYDPTSHLLHFSIFSAETPCQQFNTGGEPGTDEFGVPAADGGHTTNLLEADRCVSWLGANQPGINEDLGLPPYDPRVCPEGSTAPELCNPAGRSGDVEPGARSSPPTRPPSSPATRRRPRRRPASRPAPSRASTCPATPAATSTTCSTSRARSTTRPAAARRSRATRRRTTSSTSSSTTDDGDGDKRDGGPAMRGRSPFQSIASSPTMVGAITTLIVIVAVFLAYNANQGLPFVPTYRVSVELPNASRLTANNEVRIGGHRVGVVESIEAIRPEEGTGTESDAAATDETVSTGTTDERHRRAPQPQARQGGRPAAGGLDLPRALPLVVRPQVPRDHARGRRGGARGLHVPRHPDRRADRVRRHQQHLRHRDARPTRAPTSRASATRSPAAARRSTRRSRRSTRSSPTSSRSRACWRRRRRASQRFFPELADAARIVAPVAETQAELFTNMAIAFAAISEDEEALKETISEGPPTLLTGIDVLPGQRVFLQRVRAPVEHPAPRHPRPADLAAHAQLGDRRRHPGPAADRGA